MNILISMNKSFVKYAKDMLYSLSSNNNEFLDIYLMYNNIDQKLISKFQIFIEKKCNGKLHLIKFNEKKLKNMPVTNGGKAFFGLEAYNRLFCQYFLPESVDRILYLDVDVIVDKNLSELYNMDFEDNMYIACRDLSGIKDNEQERLGLDKEYQYVNSGVLLINVRKLREKYDINTLLSFIENNKSKLVYPDQDILNLFFYKEIKLISNKYNYVIKDVAHLTENIDEICIYHYAGCEKPWKASGGIHKKYCIPYYYNLFKQKKFFKLIYLYFIHILYLVCRKLKSILNRIRKGVV